MAKIHLNLQLELLSSVFRVEWLMFQGSSQACTCKLWLQLSVEETEPHSDQTMATSSLQLSKCEHPKVFPSIGRRQQRWSNAKSIPSESECEHAQRVGFTCQIWVRGLKWNSTFSLSP